MVNKVRLRKGASIGQPAAEADEEFLKSCFINTGCYDNLENISIRQCILLGRTGSGKSALISEIHRWKEGNVIIINPDDLALNNLANSTTINFFEESGVHLDSFYTLLWKHVLSVELLKRKYKISDEAGQRRFLSSIADLCKRDKSKDVGIKYLQSWGENFWLQTEYRIAEFTRKLEGKLEGNAEVGHGIIRMGAKGARTLSHEQKLEILQHGQRVVSDIQVKDLSKVLDILSEDIFVEGGTPYFVCIDGLDEDWVGDSIRFKLLKALLETIKSFQKVRSVKIVITMRTDLLYSLFKSISSPGFQSEKFSGYYLLLKWSRDDLYDLIDRRISYLFEHQYSGEEVHFGDIFPTKIGPKTKTLDYIIERTFFRPREAIAFLNRCLEQAEGAAVVTVSNIRAAEYLYSDDRLVALCDEWRREYPNLRRCCNLFRSISDGMEVAHLLNTKLEDFCLQFPKDVAGEERELSDLADDAAMDSKAAGLPFLRKLLSILYRTGLVGLKLSPTTTRIFSFHEGINVEPEHIELGTKVYIHKAFWITLGVRTSEFDARLIAT